MDLLVQLAVIGTFVLGISVVVGLTIFFLVLPFVLHGDGAIPEPDESDAPINAVPPPIGSRIGTMI